MRTIDQRLTRLETKAMPAAPGKRHRVIGDTEDECEAKRCAMIESGQAEETNDFIFRIIVSPPARSSPA